MVEENNKTRLGRGLAALIGDVGDEFSASETNRNHDIRKVAIEFVRPNPRNPRKHFNADELEQLASSIRERGIIQPIVVRMKTDIPDTYEIVAGERRWRAAQRADLHEVPVIVIDVDDKTSMELAIIENVQRSDLNPIDEASGYLRLIDEFGYSHNELGQILGKSRSYVANTLRLLNLPEDVRQSVIEGDLSAGHARTLLAMRNPSAMARRAIDEGLSVRELERMAQGEQVVKGDSDKKTQGKKERDPDSVILEEALEKVLGLKVQILHKGKEGELRIHYKSLDQLDTLCRRFNNQEAE